MKNESAVLAQLVEHLHGKEKVPGSNPGNGSLENRLFRFFKNRTLTSKIGGAHYELPLHKRKNQ